jgi:hypothetical protein
MLIDMVETWPSRELATAEDERPVKAGRIATAQDIPLNFLERVSVADVASGKLPRAVDRLADDPEAWVTRQRLGCGPVTTHARDRTAWRLPSPLAFACRYRDDAGRHGRT